MDTFEKSKLRALDAKIEEFKEFLNDLDVDDETELGRVTGSRLKAFYDYIGDQIIYYRGGIEDTIDMDLIGPNEPPYNFYTDWTFDDNKMSELIDRSSDLKSSLISKGISDDSANAGDINNCLILLAGFLANIIKYNKWYYCDKPFVRELDNSVEYLFYTNENPDEEKLSDLTNEVVAFMNFCRKLDVAVIKNAMVRDGDKVDINVDNDKNREVNTEHAKNINNVIEPLYEWLLDKIQYNKEHYGVKKDKNW